MRTRSIELTEEILVFSIAGGMFAATINAETGSDGPNIGDRYLTRTVLARTQDELVSRCISTLISEYGLSQEEANELVPGSMTLLAPSGGAPGGGEGEGPSMGVTDGSEAAAGEIGEYVVVSNATDTVLPSNVPTMICSISLTPGDWEIWGAVDFQPASGVSPNMIAAAVSLYPDALPSDEDIMTGVGILNMFTTSALTTGQRQMLMTGQCRSNSAEPIELHLVAQTTLGGAGILNSTGYICARRVR